MRKVTVGSDLPDQRSVSQGSTDKRVVPRCVSVYCSTKQNGGASEQTGPTWWLWPPGVQRAGAACSTLMLPLTGA